MKKLFVLFAVAVIPTALFSQPLNDDCEDATLLSVGSSCSFQSFDSNGQTAESPQPAPSPGCGFFQGSDVWFKFVVPASGAYRVERSNGTLNAQWAVYSGTCSNMEVISCAQLNAARTIHTPELAGQEVYLRVWGYNSSNGGTFNLCVWEPEIPLNNYCSDALPLTVGETCSLDTFTCVFATSDTTPNTPNPGCGFYSGGDVWFTFEVPSSGEIRIDRTNISGNAQYAVYQGTCGNFTVIDCAQLDGGTTLVLPEFANETLYLRVWGYNTEEGATFSICLWDPPIPENDLCANAIHLTTNDTCSFDFFDGRYATADTSGTAPNPGCGFYSGGDIWFTFNVPATGEIRIDRTNISGNAQYAVYQGTCGNFTVIDCAQLDGGTTLVLSEFANETLYLRVWGYNTEEGAEFSICLWDPPVPDNDLCANATELPVGDSCVFAAFSGRYATTDSAGTAPNPGCGFYSGGDVWFTLVVPSSGKLRLERQNVSGNAQFALYEGACGNFSSILSCAQLTNSLEINEPTLANETVFLRVFGYNSEEGAEFELCVFDTTCSTFEGTLTQVGNEIWVQESGQAPFTYEWLTCDGSVTFGNSSTFTPTQTGDYRVVLSNEVGCRDTTDCINFSVTEIHETSSVGFTCFPNPTSGLIEVTTTSSAPSRIEVFNHLGSLVLQQINTSSSCSVDLRSVPNGFYSIHYSNQFGESQQKIVIQH